MPRKVPHQVTLLALGRVQGKPIVIDIVETSHRNASRWTRRWLRSQEVHAIGACRPGEWPDATQTWEIAR